MTIRHQQRPLPYRFAWESGLGHPQNCSDFVRICGAQTGVVRATPVTTNRLAKVLPNAGFKRFCFVLGIGGGGTEPLPECVGPFFENSVFSKYSQTFPNPTLSRQIRSKQPRA